MRIGRRCENFMKITFDRSQLNRVWVISVYGD